jgi:hypothetical protein
MLTIPFIVKKATFTREKSVALTIDCSTTSSTATAATPQFQIRRIPVKAPNATSKTTTATWHARLISSACRGPIRAGRLNSPSRRSTSRSCSE